MQIIVAVELNKERFADSNYLFVVVGYKRLLGAACEALKFLKAWVFIFGALYGPQVIHVLLDVHIVRRRAAACLCRVTLERAELRDLAQVLCCVQCGSLQHETLVCAISVCCNCFIDRSGWTF